MFSSELERCSTDGTERKSFQIGSTKTFNCEVSVSSEQKLKLSTLKFCNPLNLSDREARKLLMYHSIFLL